MTPVWIQHFIRGCWLLVTLAAPVSTLAQTQAVSETTPAWSVQQWVTRWHQASSQKAYTGTFVVTDGVDMSASRIWHVCDGVDQFERIESLSGRPRIVLRHNDEVLTLRPDVRRARREKRQTLGAFPAMRHWMAVEGTQWYQAQPRPAERVAGVEAWVVSLKPLDGWRYGHRIWSEKNTGLVVKMQTLDAQDKVLEQVAFTDLQLNAKVSMQALAQAMDPENLQNYHVVQPHARATTAQDEGWRIQEPVPGFQSMGCHSRAEGPARHAQPLHCVFSDGLASVSLFLETFDPQKHTNAGQGASGATHTLTQRIGSHWVTAVGEVPPQTLSRMLASLERVR